MKQHIVTHALWTYEHPSLKMSMYKLFSRKSKEWATTQGRELAEGPTQLIRDNYYGPVELWPLVYIGEENDISGETVPAICGRE